MEKVVALNSGGFDSICLLHYYRHILDVEDVLSLHFLYGAPNQVQQSWCVDKVCSKLFIENMKVQLPEFSWTKGRFYEKDYGGHTGQYLEYRNLVFLSYAISIAESRGYDTIGVAAINNGSLYSDGNPVFFDMLNNISLQSGISIDTPFLSMSKYSVSHIADYLKIGKDEFFSCDSPVNGKPCGMCEDCRSIGEIYRKIVHMP